MIFARGEELVDIALTGGKTLARDVIIDGGGPGALVGSGTHRLLRVTGAAGSPRVVLQRLELRGGRATGAAVEGSGGSIPNIGGRLELVDSRVLDSQTTPGDPLAVGGALATVAGGTIVVDGTAFFETHALNGGARAAVESALAVYNARFDFSTASTTDGRGGAVMLEP